MKIVVKIIAGLLIAAILVVVGFFGYKLYQNGFNFNKTFGIGVSEKLVEEKELTIIKEIDIKFNTSDIEIKPSEDNAIKVAIYSDRDGEHSITEEEGGIVKVSINEKKLKFWKRLFNHRISRVLVYLPKDFEGKINIDGDVGDINIGDYNYSLITAKLNVGDIYIDGAKEANIDLDVGSVKLKNAYSNFNIKVDTGNVRMKEATVLKDSTIDVNIGDVRIEQTNEVKIETKVDVGKEEVTKNYDDKEITLKITVNVGNITVLAPVEEEKKEETKTND